MKIQDIEKVIDDAHKEHEVFKMNRLQAIYAILSTFEYACSSAMMASDLNPFALKNITDLMDSLNMALTWINELCPVSGNITIQLEMSEECNQQCCDFLHNYAYPYSVICSGYIAHSRKRFRANVVDNCVTFDLVDNENNSAWNDILREVTSNDLSSLSAIVDPYELLRASGEIKTRIEELFSSNSLNTVFHLICNHEYEIKMPDDVSITHQEADYSGFKFKIPAFCFGDIPE